MEERRELFDASAYMMFEAIGDSEAEYFDAVFEQKSDAAAEDDAQSCIYRSSTRLHEVVRCVEFDYCSVDEEEEESDEEEGVVDQCRRRSREAAKSNLMMMNEREADKLFWEACLAS